MNHLRRIVVIGTSGSGKTTLAREIAHRLDAPFIELDALHWGPNWTPHPDFARRVTSAVEGSDRWVVDGNYNKIRPLIWGPADAIVWLDYPMRLVFTRIVRRTFRRWWRRERLWEDNRERLWDQFCTRDSLFLWTIQTWRKHRRDYPKLLSEARQAGKQTIRLRSPAAAEAWLHDLAVIPSMFDVRC